MLLHVEVFRHHGIIMIHTSCQISRSMCMKSVSFVIFPPSWHAYTWCRTLPAQSPSRPFILLHSLRAPIPGGFSPIHSARSLASLFKAKCVWRTASLPFNACLSTFVDRLWRVPKVSSLLGANHHLIQHPWITYPDWYHYHIVLSSTNGAHLLIQAILLCWLWTPSAYSRISLPC